MRKHEQNCRDSRTDPFFDLGDPFGSPEAAAIDVHNFINPTSIVENREYASVLYQIGDKFYASPTFSGTKDSTLVGGPTDKSKIPEAIRERATRVGDYHAHGAYSKKITNPTDPKRSTIVRATRAEDPTSDQPSPRDTKRAEAIQKENPQYRFFLGTPSKELKEYGAKGEIKR